MLDERDLIFCPWTHGTFPRSYSELFDCFSCSFLLQQSFFHPAFLLHLVNPFSQRAGMSGSDWSLKSTMRPAQLTMPTTAKCQLADRYFCNKNEMWADCRTFFQPLHSCWCPLPSHTYFVFARYVAFNPKHSGQGVCVYTSWVCTPALNSACTLQPRASADLPSAFSRESLHLLSGTQPKLAQERVKVTSTEILTTWHPAF